MKLPDHRTKIVATIGPASSSPEMLERLIRAGMNIARLNFSHGSFADHGEVIRRLREASRRAERRVVIMADLPGPKIRLGAIAPGPVNLVAGDGFTLTSDDVVGGNERASMSFEALPRVVNPGDRLFLNDGLVQLVVDRVEGPEVRCTVAVGGEISSRKGLNLPGIDLGISVFTDHDRACLEFALSEGVDAVSQSFVENAADMGAVREAAREIGRVPFLIAKIERHGALQKIDEILAASDGIMIARGDLGVEVPIEEIAMLQKDLITKANEAGKPVITATQMLESMVSSSLPTRAESTDVANAILDGTDCVMLSGESAAGKFPVKAVAMLVRIAAFTESRIHQAAGPRNSPPPPFDKLATVARHLLSDYSYDALVVPTYSGTTARLIARSRPLVWILATGEDESVLRGLEFSRGIHAVHVAEDPADWHDFSREMLRDLGLECRNAVLVAGPSASHPEANQRIEFFDFENQG